MPVRKAASVFPEPVGACTSTCAPVAMTGQAASCAGVGPANARSNQERVCGVKAASASIHPGYPERRPGHQPGTGAG